MAEGSDGKSCSCDLVSLLSSMDRDYLIQRGNGEQVKVSCITGKIVGLYFSGSWCGPCQQFTTNLVETYEALLPRGDFEVVFVSSDKDEASFHSYFEKMPWLAVPFSDVETRKTLKQTFKVRAIPHLVILDETGKVSSGEGIRLVKHFGAEGYPFTPERIRYLREEEERAKQDQSLQSLLVYGSRDYLISNRGNKISVSELEGKTVGLYFAMSSHSGCRKFTSRLIEAYKNLKRESFEIVLVSLDDKVEEFREGFEAMPWLALPFKDENCRRLGRYFENKWLPQLVVIGPDGKTVSPNVVEIVEEHGEEAFPFTREKLVQLANMKKAKLEAQTLESILVSAARDFVISKDGSKVPVSELVGKNILLYFAAKWSLPCQEFLPKLVKAYQEIKAKDDGEGESFEVIFISSDHDQSSFDDFFSGMPWLALPFGDESNKFLLQRFRVAIGGIPAAIAIGPCGLTVNTQVRQLIETHGSSAFPFTKEHVKKLQGQTTEKGRGGDEVHTEHDLALAHRNVYLCNGCKEMGYGWSFLCKHCDFGLHPKCASSTQG
ncbi:probable nucleoredoxin 1 [Ipomoea triloba]|uniref:probable nucleoredoxin 1 n=1 Tax=Ipomoea triloba TaxID=35885 RepID=UPI00125E84D7|nr:probable nucleoredoxin 1 [Ipomoea triloba]